ncbi:MAG: hypothetical protein JWQ23_2648 [Herminiimonas sp.]|nr:hypothetical protein [Herminiimonas sp.]
MPAESTAAASNQPAPIILIRGFGGLDVGDERKVAYQGFNDGTVYPQKRGENYIYEGLILRFLKSQWGYQDGTNVVGYYSEETAYSPDDIPPELSALDKRFFSGDRVVLDPAMALHLVRTVKDPRRTLWVFRYYDLNDRNFDAYGNALVRLIDFIRELAALNNRPKPHVNIIAHSMGGLLARHAVQVAYPRLGRQARDAINKIVTLGTPHQGVSFQIIRNWLRIDPEQELEMFNPARQKDPGDPMSFLNFHRHFPIDRLLTVVGTNYRSYALGSASALNRLFSVTEEFGTNYNRSDGLVKQAHAQIPGAPRTFVHKCHGGFDSLVTSRESFEIAARFFFGNMRARLWLLDAHVKRGHDLFGKSEFFFGVSIKPRRVDFDLFHQSAEAENCYGPFATDDLSEDNPAFDWAAPDRMIWEGMLDTASILADSSITTKDLVLRLDFYVGERDLFGIGFSDNVVFRKQYYIRALLTDPLQLFSYADETFASRHRADDTGGELAKGPKGWEFQVIGTGFEATLGIELDVLNPASATSAVAPTPIPSPVRFGPPDVPSSTPRS